MSDTSIALKKIAAIGDPPDDAVSIYAKTDNQLYFASDAQGETALGGAHAASHTDGGDDEVTIAQAQVTGLAAALAAAEAPLDLGGAAEVGTVWAKKADFSTGFEPRVLVSDTDPGTDAGAGNLWLAIVTTPSAGTVHVLRVRNAGNTAWLPASVGFVDVEDPAILRFAIFSTGEGAVAEQYDDDGQIRNQTSWLDQGTDLWVYDAAGNLRTLLNVNGGGSPSIEAQVRNAGGTMTGAVNVLGDSVTVEHTNDAGDETQRIFLDDTGIAVTTVGSATFTYNGSEVAVVP